MDRQLPRQGFDLGRGDEPSLPRGGSRERFARLYDVLAAAGAIAAEPSLDARTPVHGAGVHRGPLAHLPGWPGERPWFRLGRRPARQRPQSTHSRSGMESISTAPPGWLMSKNIQPGIFSPGTE